jgi:hypothetical protein
MKSKVRIGDTINLLTIKECKIIRSNDRSESDIIDIFLYNNNVNVIAKNEKDIIICCYDGESYPNDNFYIMKFIHGTFTIKKHCENNQKGAIYYNEDYYGYVDEDDEFVYVAHYSIYESGINSMCKINKDKYYKNAVSINDFNYAEDCYKKEWGLVGKELA